jgi:sugar lactone lactonase YvrE
MVAVDIAFRGPFALGESIFWDEDAAALWWVDVRAPSIERWSPASGAHRRWTMPAMIGSIVPRARGGLIAGLQTGFATFDPASGDCTTIAAPEAHLPKNRPNDARCDRAGRYWCGTMEDYGQNAAGTLYRMAPGGPPEPVDGPFFVPNSTAFSPDGRIMTFCDTRRGDILAFDYDPATGRRGAARVLLPDGAAPGRPDGAAMDAEGCLWTTRYGGGAVVRVTPGGRIDRLVELPASQPTCCAFGGAGLDELYVTTAAQRLSPERLAREPGSGHVLVLRPGVRGLPESRFGG